jgi:hypothetical protein
MFYFMLLLCHVLLLFVLRTLLMQLLRLLFLVLPTLLLILKSLLLLPLIPIPPNTPILPRHTLLPFLLVSENSVAFSPEANYTDWVQAILTTQSDIHCVAAPCVTQAEMHDRNWALQSGNQYFTSRPRNLRDTDILTVWLSTMSFKWDLRFSWG